MSSGLSGSDSDKVREAFTREEYQKYSTRMASFQGNAGGSVPRDNIGRSGSALSADINVRDYGIHVAGTKCVRIDVDDTTVDSGLEVDFGDSHVYCNKTGLVISKTDVIWLTLYGLYKSKHICNLDGRRRSCGPCCTSYTNSVWS